MKKRLKKICVIDKDLCFKINEEFESPYKFKNEEITYMFNDKKLHYKSLLGQELLEYRTNAYNKLLNVFDEYIKKYDLKFIEKSKKNINERLTENDIVVDLIVSEFRLFNKFDNDTFNKNLIIDIQKFSVSLGIVENDANFKRIEKNVLEYINLKTKENNNKFMNENKLK